MRASYRSIIGTIGNPFWLNWGQEESKTQGNPSKLMLTNPKQPKKTTTSAKPRLSGPEPGFGRSTSAKPRFSGPEPGFGPDAVIFGTFGIKPKVFSCKRPPKQPTKTTSGPNPGFQAQNLGLGQMWSFWVVLRRVYTKSFHIWPKPTVDVATFNVNTVQINQQRPHLAQTQVFGNLGLGQMWSFGVVL